MTEQATRTYSPRERMVFSAAQLIRRDGVGATGMRDVAAHAEAPRGSLQHYFPGGKDQLVGEAVAWAGRYAARRVSRYLAALPADERRPSRLFAALVAQWTDECLATDFTLGCPVAAVTVDCADASDTTRTATAQAFACWREPLAAGLAELGVPRPRSAALATLMVSSLEGALLIARAERDIHALTTVSDELGPLLDAAVT